ncbi:hypothetical protein SLE2022_196100 [Rubroshorea leprosula]
MGKGLSEHSDVEFEDYHPSCMWGIRHVLDSNHWYNVKKMLPYRRYQKGRRAGCCANPKTISLEHDPGEEDMRPLDAESDIFQVEQKIESSKINKNSRKSSLKALIEKEKSEEENKHRILNLSMQSQLSQTDSIHSLEPSGSGLGWMNPIILIQKRANTSSTRMHNSSLPENLEKLVRSNKNIDFFNGKNSINQKKMHSLFQEKSDQVEQNSINQKSKAKKLDGEVSSSQVKKFVDVLEIFRVKKELFFDILQHPDVGISNHFPASNRSRKLTKSGSFPVFDSFHNRRLKPSTLEHKQKEIWSFSKAGRLLDGTQVLKSRASETDDTNGVENTITQETSLSFQGANHQRWDQIVVNHVKDLKQRIKHALKEKRRWGYRKNMKGLPSDKKEMSGSSRKTSMSQDGMKSPTKCNEVVDVLDHDRNNSLYLMRRTTSLNESLDRYAQLFQHNFSKEPALHQSRSLKLRDEEKVSSRGRIPKYVRRISSLSDLESICSILNELSRDALSSEMPIRSASNCVANNERDGDNLEPQEATPGIKFREKVIEENDHCSIELSVDRNNVEIAELADISEDMVEPETGEDNPHQEQENVFTINASRELIKPSSESIPHTSSLDGLTSQADPPISEGSELNSQEDHHKDEAHTSFIGPDGHDHLGEVSLSATCCSVNDKNVKHETEGINNYSLHSDKEGDVCFNYVRDVLELSGFIENEILRTWYSPDQPLNPSLFKELETCLHQVPESSFEKDGINCYRQLLFDLVNEALLEISNKSAVYFPKAFSFSSRVCRSPKGHQLLPEIWAKVCGNLESTPDLDQSLDDIVSRDLEKDSWMNHQLEAECVALDLEDMIFYELLHEVVCF